MAEALKKPGSGKPAVRLKPLGADFSKIEKEFYELYNDCKRSESLKELTSSLIELGMLVTNARMRHQKDNKEEIDKMSDKLNEIKGLVGIIEKFEEPCTKAYEAEAASDRVKQSEILVALVDEASEKYAAYAATEDLLDLAYEISFLANGTQMLEDSELELMKPSYSHEVGEKAVERAESILESLEGDDTLSERAKENIKEELEPRVQRIRKLFNSREAHEKR